MKANAAYWTRYNNPPRARLRGLARNPTLTGPALLRMYTHPERMHHTVLSRREWTREAFDTLAGHPDAEVRAALAQSEHLTPELRARLVDDPSRKVRAALAEGPQWRAYWERREPLLPHWAYARLAADEHPAVRDTVRSAYHAPAEFREPDRPAGPADPADPDVLARSADQYERANAARDPALPAELVAALAADPEPDVRLAVSMRRELTEAERAAIDYRVAPGDRIRPAGWATTTTDPDEIERCVRSAHLGLRRSVAYNPRLQPEQIAVLAADGDFAVRLLLCENHRVVPGETVLATYLESRVITAAAMLHHPSFPRRGLAAGADSPDPRLRALAHLDPDAPAGLVDRLSRDEDPRVRGWTAQDRRLTAARVLELLEDPATAEPAAANPNLPVNAWDRIFAEAEHIVDPDVGEQIIYLGRSDD
ncbi:hypothetical protein [Dactylosporangium sp. CA-092794]|uniref:hypothetical protein n=1 Tax=Dactylosporangium sp. CA-092794 TaxID=3239929 RepID=UPI003D8A936D